MLEKIIKDIDMEEATVARCGLVVRLARENMGKVNEKE